MAIAAVPNTSSSSSDEAFLRAFGDIYREHYQLVYRTAYSVTGSRQDAEDVLQTCFHESARSRPSGRAHPKSEGVLVSSGDQDVLQNIFVKLLERELPSALMRNPKAYLYRAAVNLALNTVRTRKRQRLTDGVELLEKAAPEVPPIPGDEVRRRLMDAIAQLKPKAVEILILRYEHNYSDVQIAQTLGTSRGTVAVTLNRTRARLKKLIDAASGDKS